MRSGLLQYLKFSGSSSVKLQPGGRSGTGFYKLRCAGKGMGLLSEKGYHEKFITHACHTHRCLEAVNNIQSESSCYK